MYAECTGIYYRGISRFLTVDGKERQKNKELNRMLRLRIA